MPHHLCEKIVSQRPELIGKHVWFCPNKAQKLECIINDDGSISACESPEKSFTNSKDLIAAISNNSIRVGNFKLPEKGYLKKCQFTTNLCIFPHRGLVNYYACNPELPLPIEASDKSSSGTICRGFIVDDQDDRILEGINSWSVRVSAFDFVVLGD